MYYNEVYLWAHKNMTKGFPSTSTGAETTVPLGTKHVLDDTIYMGGSPAKIQKELILLDEEDDKKLPFPK